MPPGPTESADESNVTVVSCASFVRFQTVASMVPSSVAVSC